MNSLHNSYKGQGGGNVLEISTKELDKLGINLRLFNLLLGIISRNPERLWSA
ncbi:hypothetical protein [Lachnoanaerobaculum saburreum]|uniref:hypothetical protein n=1 Tax=Lachnoanaerobaculum saburreum TaxID=467210 RepID=UPI003A7F33DB